MKHIILIIYLLMPLSIFSQKTELIIPVGHKEIVGIYDVAVSKDSKLVVSVAGKTAKIWDYSSGHLLKTFQYNNKNLSKVAITPDGKKILLTYEGLGLLVLDANTYEIIKTISGVSTWDVEVASDNQTVYTAAYSSPEVMKVNINTGSAEVLYKLPEGTETAGISLSPDGKQLLAYFSKARYGGEPMISVIINTANGQGEILPENTHYQCFTPLGNILSIVSVQDKTNYKTTYKFKWTNSATMAEIGHQEFVVNKLASNSFSLVKHYDFFKNSNRILFSYGSNLMTIAPDETAKEIEFTDPRKNNKSFNLKSKYPVLANDNEVVVGTDDNLVVKLNLKEKTLATTYGIGVLAPKEIRPSESGKSFVVTGYDDKPYFITWENARAQIRQFSDAKNKTYYVKETSANVSPDGSIAAYGTDYRIKVVDGRNPKTELNVLDFDKTHHLVIAPDNNTIVASGDDETVSVIDRKFNAVKNLGKGDFTEGGITADSRYFYGLHVNGKLTTILSYFDILNGKKLWEISDNEHVLGRNPFIFDKNEVGFVDFRNRKLIFLKTSDGSTSRIEDLDSYNFPGKPDLQTKLKYEEVNKANSNDGYWTSKILEKGAFYIKSWSDNTLKIYRSSTSEKVGEIILASETGDWAVVTPDGRFDASEAMMKSLYYTKGRQIIPLEALSEKFYTPNLLALIFSKTNEPEPKREDINTLKSPPSVKIGVPMGQRNLVVEDENTNIRQYNMAFEKIKLTIEATCSDDAISEIRLFHNGKVVGSGTRNLVVADDTPEKFKTQTFEIQLVEGENKFKAIVLNTQRTESQPDEIVVNYKPTKQTSPSGGGGTEGGATLHLMVIGINKYKNPKYNLNYATADATSFKETIEGTSSSIFNKINISYVGDDKATKEAITSELNKIKDVAQAKDVFIFYYAGHGVLNQNKEFYLVPHDVTQLYGNDDALAQKGLSANQLQQYSKDIKAQKQLFILDACQSAGALDQVVAARGVAEEKAIAQLARATGTHWLTASGSEQFASEFTQLGHGTFTYVLLEALSGKADKGGDKKITVKELDAYLQEKVPEITEKYKGTPQYPASYGFGNDFPIGVVKQ